MSGWTEGSSSLGKAAKKPRKVVHEVRTRKGKSGGFIHEHHHTHPEAHPMEEHVSPDQDAMLQHMAQTMGSGGGAATPDASDAAAAGGDASQGAPAAPAGPAVPGM